MSTTSPTTGPETYATPEAGEQAWASAWRRALPVLALVGPGSWFVGALIRAAGIGTLDGDLDWASGPEGIVMSLGVAFFAATFVLMGMVVARTAVRSGIAVTALGILGLSAWSGISFFRLFVAKFTDDGIDPDALNASFEASHVWDLGMITNFVAFGAWIVAGIVILKTAVVPRWIGVCCLGGVVAVVLGQAAYVALGVFWPLGTGLWVAATAGLAVAFRR